MKKILILISVILSFAVFLCSCGENTGDSTTTSADNVGVANPVSDYSSLEDINKSTGCALTLPAGYEVKEESFNVINDEIAQYKFVYNDYDFCFRASSSVKDDISGVYMGESLAFEGRTGDFDVVSDTEYKLCRFYVDEVQYVLSVLDYNAISEEDFNETGLAFRSAVICSVSDNMDNLEGTYQDITSEKAIAEIMLTDKNTVNIIIYWSNTSDSGERWMITASKSGDKLTYTADNIYHYSYTSDGEVTTDDSTDGYFEITDSGICWTGSGSESTINCVFVSD